MNKGSRLYIAGYMLAAVFSMIGEVIWLGDPLRFGRYYWIDEIQRLVGLLALVPLLWLAGALAGMAAGSGAGRLHRLLRRAVAAGSVISAASILFFTDRLVAVIVIAGCLWLLTLLDLFVTEKRRHAGWPWRSLVTLALTLLIGAGLFWPTPYGVTSPGFTLNMNRYASAEGGAPKGWIEGVLVIERPAYPVDWLFAAMFPHVQISKRDTSISIGEMSQQAQAQRLDANQIGSAVAFQKLGIGRGVVPTGIRVLKINDGSPAANQLAAGDVITAVNGHAALSIDQLAAAMEDVRPGDEVDVTLLRNGSRTTVTAATGEDAGDAARPVFGIQVENLAQADLPKKVGYRSYLVYQGGPSHGAMLALTLIDQLTPGGVTYGNRVAGTGTIDADGKVGPIGGIEQKAYAVGRSGANVFFVPEDQENDARKGSPSLNIVPVRTLDDILGWLKSHPRT